jgi:hypothetical protein
MKTFFTKASLGAVAALLTFAIPGSASTVLTFNSSGVGGAIDTTGGLTGVLNTGAGLVEATNFSSINVTGANADNGTWTLSGSPTFQWLSGSDAWVLTGTLTCSFAVNGCGTIGTNVSVSSTGTTAATALMFIQLSVAPTATFGAGNTTAKVAIANATSIKESTTFLTDLGLGLPSTTNIAAGSFIQGSSGTACSVGNCSFTDFSNTLSITMTPEPVSFMMLGSGLLLIGVFARRRMQGTPATVSVK